MSRKTTTLIQKAFFSGLYIFVVIYFLGYEHWLPLLMILIAVLNFGVRVLESYR
jgi:hypothetical protein